MQTNLSSFFGRVEKKKKQQKQQQQQQQDEEDDDDANHSSSSSDEDDDNVVLSHLSRGVTGDISTNGFRKTKRRKVTAPILSSGQQSKAPADFSSAKTLLEQQQQQQLDQATNKENQTTVANHVPKTVVSITSSGVRTTTTITSSVTYQEETTASTRNNYCPRHFSTKLRITSDMIAPKEEEEEAVNANEEMGNDETKTEKEAKKLSLSRTNASTSRSSSSFRQLQNYFWALQHPHLPQQRLPSPLFSMPSPQHQRGQHIPRQHLPTWYRYPQQWKSSPWVALQGAATTATVQHLAWDPTGVLLAVVFGTTARNGTSSLVQLYEWDTVRAMHVQGQSFHQRQQATTTAPGTTSSNSSSAQRCTTVAPLLSFSTKQAISTIQWNTHGNNQNDDDDEEEDALIVGYKQSARVDWIPLEPLLTLYLDRQAANAQGRSSLPLIPPPTMITSFWYPRSSGTVRGLRLLPEETHQGKAVTKTLLVLCNKTVYAWKIHGTSMAGNGMSKPTVRLHWRYQLPQTKGGSNMVTSCLPIGRQWIIFGTSLGSMLVLDWTRTTRESSFSSERRPVVVVEEWTPHRRLWKESQKDPSQLSFFRNRPAKAMKSNRMPSCWGVVQIQMVTNNNNDSTTPDVKGEGSCHGLRTVRWVTAGGWVLQCSLEITDGSNREKRRVAPSTANMRILHQPPRVKLQSCDGEDITQRYNINDGADDYDSLFSLPLDKVCAFACSTSSLLLWSHVPSSVKRMGHHDKYVVESGQPQLLRSQTNKRFVRILSTARCHTSDPLRAGAILMPTRSATGKSPQVMTVHPDLEWMVAGVEHQLCLMVGRN